MEKLKHTNLLPDFKEGDSIVCAVKSWTHGQALEFIRYKDYCTKDHQMNCRCKGNGKVILVKGGHNHCIWTGDLTSEFPNGTLVWKKEGERSNLPAFRKSET